MKCYYHPSVDAVASCKSCCRALCRECIAEVDTSCSCRGRCEADVATLNELVERGRSAYQKTSTTYFASGTFMAFLGGLFFLLGLFGILSAEFPEGSYFALFVGGLFICWGASMIVSGLRFRQK